VLGVGKDVIGGSQFDHPPKVHYRNAVAEVTNNVQVV
jgi:hypothetical protein